MLAELITLREEVSELKSIIQKNAVAIESKDIEIERLEMELGLLRQKMYGPKSEKIEIVDPIDSGESLQRSRSNSKDR